MKTTINKKMRVITVALLLSGLVPSTMMAQDKVEASVGADLVSGYIWRCLLYTSPSPRDTR